MIPRLERTKENVVPEEMTLEAYVNIPRSQRRNLKDSDYRVCIDPKTCREWMREVIVAPLGKKF